VISHESTKKVIGCYLQGPSGKDGLPGHPGTRGEPVSYYVQTLYLH